MYRSKGNEKYIYGLFSNSKVVDEPYRIILLIRPARAQWHFRPCINVDER